jgi:uncharacterized flavoprotein (TIGR03862 family)
MAAMSPAPIPQRVAVIGGGPAGLMAAERLRAGGAEVDLFDAKGSVGRKFLIAGKGGLNLTHSDPPAAFVSRYAERSDWVGAWLADFDAEALRAWARGLGVETRVGSSGRVFPVDLKAAPLLRGWVRRLREQGVRFHVQHRWFGWNDDGALVFDTPHGRVSHVADATVLALGGASWPELGSDGAWVETLHAYDLRVAPLKPANCGFETPWSEVFRLRFAGAPVKPVAIALEDQDGEFHSRQGEFIVTAHGIEGSLVYALSAPLREALLARGSVTLLLDLAPERDEASLRAALAHPRGHRTVSEHLRRRAGLEGVKAGLLHELLPRPLRDDAAGLAAAIKSLPLTLHATRPIEEAISTAGGVRAEDLDDALMLRARPGTFCAGEMLDWEAPTGGYLLTACFASGVRAADGVLRWLEARA